jgi:hypothetical protein
MVARRARRRILTQRRKGAEEDAKEDAKEI